MYVYALENEGHVCYLAQMLRDSIRFVEDVLGMHLSIVRVMLLFYSLLKEGVIIMFWLLLQSKVLACISWFRFHALTPDEVG